MIEIKNISKYYVDDFGYKIELFENISFDIASNKITTLIAPSGTGKTSLLKIVSGLEIPSNGEVINKNETVIFIPSEPSTFPWLNTEENIIYALKEKDRKEINEIIKITGLEGYEKHYPNNKSIGYRFRVALARSLARKPSLIVIDEPFNKMDELTKLELYQLIRTVTETLRITFLFSTTNISEAIFLSDYIYLLQKNPGRIIKHFEIKFSEIRDQKIFLSEKFNEYSIVIKDEFRLTNTQILVNITI